MVDKSSDNNSSSNGNKNDNDKNGESREERPSVRDQEVHVNGALSNYNGYLLDNVTFVRAIAVYASSCNHVLMRQCRFVECDLSTLSFDRGTLQQVRFEQVNLSGASFSQCLLEQVEFDTVHVNYKVFRCATLTLVRFRNTHCQRQRSEYEFCRCELQQVMFSPGLRMVCALVSQCKCKGVEFRDVDMSQSMFSHTNFFGSLPSKFCNVMLRHSCFAFVQCENVEFDNCKMDYIKCYNNMFTNCKFTNMTSMQLIEARTCMFCNCEFDNVDLSMSQLSTCSFIGCTFKKVAFDCCIILRTVFDKDCVFEDMSVSGVDATDSKVWLTTDKGHGLTTKGKSSKK